MNKKLFQIITFLVACVILISFFVTERMPRLKTGEYMIYHKEPRFFTSPTKLVVSEGGMALYYADKGFVSFFSLDGVFLYGIQVDKSDKGKNNLAYLDGKWVIVSRNSTVYFFDGEKLCSWYHVTINENLEQYRILESRMGDNSSLTCVYLGKTYRYSVLKRSIIVESD